MLEKPMADITAILDSHIPEDEKEARDIAYIKQLMNENPNLLNKNCENGHFTGSALVVDLSSRTFLLHLHKKSNRWFQFGGHPEYETDLAEVALREAIEETGLTDLYNFPTAYPAKPLDIDVHFIPKREREPEHPHLDFRYLLVTNSPEKLLKENANESLNFRWFAFANTREISNLVDPALYRLILKAKNLVEAKQYQRG